MLWRREKRQSAAAAAPSSVEPERDQTIVGALQLVVDGYAWGWVGAAPDEDAPSRVCLLIDGVEAASGAADVDVPGQGSDRRRTFRIPIPAEFAAERLHTISAVTEPEGRQLPPSSAFAVHVTDPSSAWAGVEFHPETEHAADHHLHGAIALIGDEGWLFLWRDRHDALGQVTGPSEPTEAELEELSGHARRRAEALAALNAPVVSAIAPMKERVYADRLPPEVGDPGDRRAVEAVLGSLAEAGVLSPIDLFAPLVEARQRGQEVYHRTDSQLAPRGALVASLTILDAAAPLVDGLEVPDADEAESLLIPSRRPFSGDLAGRPKIALNGSRRRRDIAESKTWREPAERLDPERARARRVDPPPYMQARGPFEPLVYEIPDEEQLPSAVLVGDAACLGLIPWLAESFSRLAFVPCDEPPAELIELELPDVILHVHSEHLQMGRPPSSGLARRSDLMAPMTEETPDSGDRSAQMAERATTLKERADKLHQRAQELDGRAAKSTQQAREHYARAEVLLEKASRLERRSSKTSS